MTAGEIGRRRVAFDKRGDTSGNSPPGDGYGNYDDAWAEQFQRSARIRPLTGGEEVLASRLAGVQPYIISVRRDSQTKLVATGWRVRDVGDSPAYLEFNITSIINKDEKNRYLDMMATAGVAV